jgi:hypothetical protein
MVSRWVKKILSYPLMVLSLAALFAAGLMTTTMTTQTVEAKEKVYCPEDIRCSLDKKKDCEAVFGEGVCVKRKFG